MSGKECWDAQTTKRRNLTKSSILQLAWLERVLEDHITDGDKSEESHSRQAGKECISHGKRVPLVVSGGGAEEDDGKEQGGEGERDKQVIEE